MKIVWIQVYDMTVDAVVVLPVKDRDWSKVQGSERMKFFSKEEALEFNRAFIRANDDETVYWLSKQLLARKRVLDHQRYEEGMAH